MAETDKKEVQETQEVTPEANSETTTAPTPENLQAWADQIAERLAAALQYDEIQFTEEQLEAVKDLKFKRYATAAAGDPKIIPEAPEFEPILFAAAVTFKGDYIKEATYEKCREDIIAATGKDLTEEQAEPIKESISFVFTIEKLFFSNYRIGIVPDETIQKGIRTAERLSKAQIEQLKKQRPELFSQEDDTDEPQKPTRGEQRQDSLTAKKKAAEAGAIMGIDTALFPSADKEWNALTKDRLFVLSPSINREKSFDGKGILNPLVLKDSKNLIANIDEAHTGFYGTLLAYVKQAADNGETGTKVNIHIPSFIDSLGTEPRLYSSDRNTHLTSKEARRDYILDLLAPVDRVIWRGRNKNLYSFAHFSQYDSETETVTIDAPALFELVKTDKLNRRIYSSIAAERDKAAAEVVVRIVNGLISRGLTPDAELKQNAGKNIKDPDVITWSASYKTIIDDCPNLRDSLKKAAATKSKGGYNTYLSRHFKAAFNILAKHTDVYSYYRDFRIITTNKTGDETRLPTKSTIDSTYLTIKHKGKAKK